MSTLDIDLPDPGRIWKSGDEISGVVKINQAKPAYAQQITVSLRGIARCRFGLPELDSLYSAEVLLLEESINLLPEPITLQHQPYSWPFKFIVPDYSREHRSPFQEPSRLYNNSSIQPLPPSFTVAKKETASSQDTCSITYGIYLSIDNGKARSNLFKRDELETFRLIDFQPDRRHVEPQWKMVTKRCEFECRTPLLNANGDAKRSLSIKEKVLTTLKPSSAPSAAFSVLISIPKEVVVGQPIPLFMGVQHDSTSSSVHAQPIIELKSLAIKLEALTGVRGLVENRKGPLYQPASHSSWTKTTELGKFSGSLPLDDVTDLRLHLDLTVPKDFVESFSTFNIARAYTAKIQAAVECAKEKFKANFEIYPIVLLASHVLDSEHPPGIGARPSLRPAASDSESLPSWTESGGYGGLIPLAEKEEAEAPPNYA